MRHFNQTNYLIFSAYKSEFKVETNLKRHKEMLDILKRLNIKFKSLIGSYYGNREISVMVDDIHREEVMGVVEFFKQDSLMFLGHDKAAELVYIDKRPDQALGLFKEITHAQALDSDFWTYDPDLDQYYRAGGLC